MAIKPLVVKVEERKFEKDGKTINYKTLVLTIETLNGPKEIALTCSNPLDKYALKEYIRSLK